VGLAEMAAVDQELGARAIEVRAGVRHDTVGPACEGRTAEVGEPDRPVFAAVNGLSGKMLEDVSLTSASWRRQALRALEVIGAADTIDAVTRCLEDPDRHVREAAAAALRTLPPRV